MKATFLEDVSSNFTGTAKLYELSEPVEFSKWEDGEEVDCISFYVIVSAVVAERTGPETYIFPADREGNVLSWHELPGSFRGAIDIEAALENMGCDVIESE